MSEKNVQVALRVRPMVEHEILDDESNIVLCQQKNIQISNKEFNFDIVFSPQSTQQEVFEYAKPLIDQSFQGYNATILAYGQTGSGKTYTMGTHSNQEYDSGLVPRVIEYMFSKLGKDFAMRASFSEIHNEEIKDLLDFSNKIIQIREDKNGIISILGLSEESITSQNQLLRLMHKGSLYRSTSSTLMNSQSSRSHAIFTIFLENLNLNTFSKFHFVDLAGSERLKRTGAEGLTLKEGIHINKGLLCLGNVISGLTSTHQSYIPYRDSKLTRILQDSLGGNAFTIMIACISPASTNLEETLNTLKYASRARHIKNKPIINTDPNLIIIQQLKEQVKDLQQELAMYKPQGDNEIYVLNKQILCLKQEVQDLKIQLNEKEILLQQNQSSHCNNEDNN